LTAVKKEDCIHECKEISRDTYKRLEAIFPQSLCTAHTANEEGTRLVCLRCDRHTTRFPNFSTQGFQNVSNLQRVNMMLIGSQQPYTQFGMEDKERSFRNGKLGRELKFRWLSKGILFGSEVKEAASGGTAARNRIPARLRETMNLTISSSGHEPLETWGYPYLFGYSTGKTTGRV